MVFYQAEICGTLHSTHIPTLYVFARFGLEPRTSRKASEINCIKPWKIIMELWAPAWQLLVQNARIVRGKNGPKWWGNGRTGGGAWTLTPSEGHPTWGKLSQQELNGQSVWCLWKNKIWYCNRSMRKNYSYKNTDKKMKSNPHFTVPSNKNIRKNFADYLKLSGSFGWFLTAGICPKANLSMLQTPFCGIACILGGKNQTEQLTWWASKE